MYICYMFTLLMGIIVAGLRPIFTSPFNINSWSPIARVRVTGLLWPRSTFINTFSAITRGRFSGQTWLTPTTSAITWGRVTGLLRPMYKAFTTSTITLVRVAGLERPMSTTFFSPNDASMPSSSELSSSLLQRLEE